MSSDEGLAFLKARSAVRSNAGALATLDMLGRQAPAPDSTPTPVTPEALSGASIAVATPSPTGYRLVASFGRGDDVWIIGLEQAPDWDLVQTWTFYNGDIARGIIKVVSAMLGPKGIKDLTGELHGVGSQVVPAKPKSAPAHSRPARQPTARQQAYYRRGGKNRAPDAAVGQRGATDGPPGSGPGKALVLGAAANLPQASESGG